MPQFTWPRAPVSIIEDHETTERNHRAITKAMKSGFLRHLKNLDFDALPPLFHPDFIGHLPSVDDYQDIESQGGLKIKKFEKSASTEANLGTVAFIKQLRADFGNAAMVERMNWQAFTSLSSSDPTDDRHFVQSHFLAQ